MVITGALVDGQGADNAFNGSFQIDEPIGSHFFTFELKVAPPAQPTGEMWIGRRPSHMVGIKPKADPGYTDLYNPGADPIVVTGTGPWTVSVITQTPHMLVPGNDVFMQFVVTDPIDRLNGLFRVADVSNPTKFSFITTVDPETVPTTQLTAFINPSHVGLTNHAGAGSVTHNNRVFGARTGYYHDTHPTKDTTVKRNLFHAMQFGIVDKLVQDGLRGDKLRAGTLVGTQGSNIATYTTVKRHTLAVGQAVVIDGAGSGYDGTCEIVDVPSAFEIKILLPGTPAASVNEADVAYSLWQVGRWIIDRNIIDQILHPLKWSSKTNGYSTEGILFNGALRDPAVAGLFIFPEAIVRGNVIQNVDNALEISGLITRSLLFQSAGVAGVVKNILSVEYDQVLTEDPLTVQPSVHAVYEKSGLITVFATRSAGGRYLQAYHKVSAVRYDSKNNIATDTDFMNVLL